MPGEMKAEPNVALKVAIVESGRSQRVLSRVARIPETRLSHIVRGRIEPTAKEMERISKALARPVDELFHSRSAA